MERDRYKAAIFRGIGNVELVDRPFPVCGDDDVIVRNVLTGVCGSDIEAFRSGGDDYLIWKDHEFGHEIVSEIFAVGENVVGLEIGDLVFPNPGKAHRDPMRASTVGGYSEFIHIPKCEVGYSVLKFDKDIPLKAAVLFEPFSVGARAAHGLNPQSGQTAIVFGAGIIGICTAIMLQWYGCDKVMIVDVSDFRLSKARHLGLMTCNPSTEDVATKAAAEFGTQSTFFGERCAADIYVDAIGKRPAIDSFESMACLGATLCIVGVHHEPAAIDLGKLCFNNLHITGAGTLPTEDTMPDITAMMKSGQYDIASLITHEFTVDDIEQALVMGTKVEQAQKVCIAF